MTETSKIAVLGSGTWGATLSWLYASNGKSVSLWTRNNEKAQKLNKERRVDRPLPVSFPASIQITMDLKEALSGANFVLFCCTSQSMRAVAETVRPILNELAAKPILVSAAKGLELNTLKRMSQILSESLPGHQVCALSGPNLAAEILAGSPTASVIAADDLALAQKAQRALTLSKFRLYSNDDLVGVELGGTLKNVIAVAAGCSDGLNLGANAKAALVTRGLAEITRLSMSLGAKPLTMSGLSGMGDLIATCNSSLSRNYRLGLAMARGSNPQDAILSVGATAEGVTTAEAVCELSKKLGIQMPIADQVNATLKGNTSPEGAIMTLMNRPLVSE